MSCSTGATGGAIRAASKPSIDAAGAAFVTAGAEPATGSAEAVTARVEPATSDAHKDIGCLYAYIPSNVWRIQLCINTVQSP